MTRRGLPVGPPPAELQDFPLQPRPEESPFLRPRRRARLTPRRRGLSARLALALQVAAVGLIAVIALWLAWQRVFASERLRVAHLEVRGGHFLSEGEVRELVAAAVGENILSLDIEDLKARLRSSPWVADAVVTRSLPDTLRVEIRERVPLALAELDRLYLMDADGGLIDLYGPRTGAFDLPIVRGLLGVEQESRGERARRAGGLLADLSELAAEISEVYVLPTGDLRVVLRGPGEVLLFGDPPYRQRLVTFLALRKDLAERAPRAEHFDLRYRGRIYAKQPAVEAPRQATPVPNAFHGPSRGEAGGGRVTRVVPAAGSRPQSGAEARRQPGSTLLAVSRPPEAAGSSHRSTAPGLTPARRTLEGAAAWRSSRVGPHPSE